MEEQMVLLLMPNTSSLSEHLWQMGPGSWTRLISSTPPLKGTVELYLHSPGEPWCWSHINTGWTLGHVNRAECACQQMLKYYFVKMTKSKRIMCLIYSNMLANGIEETVEEQRENGRKRWSISVKLGDKYDHSKGYLDTEWLAFCNGQLKLLSLLSISPASMQIQNASSLALPGPDHVCAPRSQSWHVDNSHKV